MFIENEYGRISNNKRGALFVYEKTIIVFWVFQFWVIFFSRLITSPLVLQTHKQMTIDRYQTGKKSSTRTNSNNNNDKNNKFCFTAFGSCCAMRTIPMSGEKRRDDK